MKRLHHRTFTTEGLSMREMWPGAVLLTIGTIILILEILRIHL